MLSRHLRDILQLSSHTLSLLVCMTLMVVIEGILWYIVPSYFTDILGIEKAGLALAAYGFGALLSSLPAGDLTDGIGRKFMFFGGMALFVSSLILLHLPFFIAALAFMFSLGMSSSCMNSGGLNYMLDHIPNQSAGRANGLYMTFRGIGWSLGGVAGGVLIALLPFSISITLLLGIAIFILWFFYRKEPHAPLTWSTLTKSVQRLKRDRLYLLEFKRVSQLGLPIVIYSLYSFVYGFYEYAVIIAEPLYTASIGTNIILAGLLLSLISLPQLIFSTPIGKLIDKFGGRIAIMMGIVLGIVGHGYFLFFSNHNLTALAVSFLCIAISEICLLLPFHSHIHLYAPKNTQAQAYSLGDSLFNIGGIIAPFIIAFTFANALNFQYLLSITGIGYMTVWVALIVLMIKDRAIFQKPVPAVVVIKS